MPSLIESAMESPLARPLLGLITRVFGDDYAKVMRFVAVSAISVPLTMVCFWLLLRFTSLNDLVANLIAIAISTVPNYLLNRYWVWRKNGPNSVAREIAPYWAITFLGTAMSLLFVWIAGLVTSVDLVLVAASFVAFGLVWVLKFLVLERFLFGEDAEPESADITR